MPSNVKIFHQETLDTINNLFEEGVKRAAVIMRHSARNFTDDPAEEPFMGLTETGKDFSLKLGENLALSPSPRFFSSHFGRCIETSAIIDKGYYKTHRRFNGHNQINLDLSPFYINDIDRAITLVRKIEAERFIRQWFNGEFSQEIIMDPKNTADRLAGFLAARVEELDDNEIALCVSHDWNLFPLKEFKLGLKHEDVGVVGFLESVVVFEQQGNYYITGHQTRPQRL